MTTHGASGVGITMELASDARLLVSAIHPKWAADLCGSIQVWDEVLKIDGFDVEKKATSALPDAILGAQGTLVNLTLRRTKRGGPPRVFEVELLRGAPEFLELVSQTSAMAKEQITVEKVHQRQMCHLYFALPVQLICVWPTRLIRFH